MRARLPQLDWVKVVREANIREREFNRRLYVVARRVSRVVPFSPSELFPIGGFLQDHGVPEETWELVLLWIVRRAVRLGRSPRDYADSVLSELGSRVVAVAERDKQEAP